MEPEELSVYKVDSHAINNIGQQHHQHHQAPPIYSIPPGGQPQHMIIATVIPKSAHQPSQVVVVDNDGDDEFDHHQRTVLPTPPPGTVFKARIQSGYGITRLIQFVLASAHLGLVATVISKCVSPYYYVPLLVFPILTMLKTFLQLFRFHCRSWAHRGCNDFIWAIYYVGHCAAIVVLYHRLWTSLDVYIDAVCFVSFDLMVSAAATAGVLSISYWIVAFSVCCCHCLDINMPQHYTNLM